MIQKLLRGRAIQNIMYIDKEKRLALVEELLAVANIEQKSAAEAEEDLLQIHETKVKEAVLESIQGEVMARTFDMLSKELVRFKQERKINKLMNLAENDRRKREAEERGGRQAEEILGNREDQIYKEIVRLNQNTVDHLLENLMEGITDNAASREASMLVGLRREKIDSQTNQLEKKARHTGSMIKDVMMSFLIPNIERRKLQKKIEMEERRFNTAAQASLKLAVTKVNKR